MTWGVASFILGNIDRKYLKNFIHQVLTLYQTVEKEQEISVDTCTVMYLITSLWHHLYDYNIYCMPQAFSLCRAALLYHMEYM